MSQEERERKVAELVNELQIVEVFPVREKPPKKLTKTISDSLGFLLIDPSMLTPKSLQRIVSAMRAIDDSCFEGIPEEELRGVTRGFKKAVKRFQKLCVKEEAESTQTPTVDDYVTEFDGLGIA